MSNLLPARYECRIRIPQAAASRFRAGLALPPQGMHDVHCNQGDPAGPFQHLDAIWQDGGVIVQYTDAHLEVFFVKFETQTLHTNDQGLPA